MSDCFNRSLPCDTHGSLDGKGLPQHCSFRRQYPTSGLRLSSLFYKRKNLWVVRRNRGLITLVRNRHVQLDGVVNRHRHRHVVELHAEVLKPLQQVRVHIDHHFDEDPPPPAGLQFE